MSQLGDQMIAEARDFESRRKESIELGKNRLLVASAVFFMGFLAIGLRLFDLTIFSEKHEIRFVREIEPNSTSVVRGNILDRNGIVLATSLPTASLYADPYMVLDAKEAASKLMTVFPDLNKETLYKKMTAHGRFVWLKRNLSPDQQYMVNRLGIPGLGFQRGEKRIQPHGRLAAHIIGLTDIDGRGISGIECYFNNNLKLGRSPVRLALDLRIQDILHRELTSGIEEYGAIGAAGIVMDVRNGEIIAMVSLPDFDPNNNRMLDSDATFNRVATGVYEMGSIFKLFTAAMALDSGVATMSSRYDASDPIKVSRFKINDFHAQKRWLTLPEIILHSSNIGAAKMAIDAGSATQKEYFSRFGLLNKIAIELPEIGRPIKPAPWREINTMTIAFGHGLAVTPLQLASGIAGLVNNGIQVSPTLLKRIAGKALDGEQVIASDTSHKIRQLMRLVVAKGTGRRAEASGYFVGGKTGTAQKQLDGKYVKKANLSSFLGVFPIYAPQYLVLAILDEPKGNKSTLGHSTGGWVAAPIVKRVVQTAGPILGLAPKKTKEELITLPDLKVEKANTVDPSHLVKKASAENVLRRSKGKFKKKEEQVVIKKKGVRERAHQEAAKISSMVSSRKKDHEESLIEMIAQKSLHVMEQELVN